MTVPVSMALYLAKLLLPMCPFPNFTISGSPQLVDKTRDPATKPAFTRGLENIPWGTLGARHEVLMLISTSELWVHLDFPICYT